MPSMIPTPVAVEGDLVAYLDAIRPGKAADLERRGIIQIVEHPKVKEVA